MSITKSTISRFIFGNKFAETQKLFGKNRKFESSSSSSLEMAHNMGRPLSDFSIFKYLLHDFSTGSFVPDGPVDFWDYRFWAVVCSEFNERSGMKYPVNKILDMGRELQSEFCAQRAAKDMKDEKLWSIFEACPTCRAKIPVFPTSLKQPSSISIFISISSGSGSGSGSRRRKFDYGCAYGASCSAADMAKIRGSVFELIKKDLIDSLLSHDIFAALDVWLQIANKLSLSVLTEDDTPVEVKASFLKGVIDPVAST